MSSALAPILTELWAAFANVHKNGSSQLLNRFLILFVMWRISANRIATVAQKFHVICVQRLPHPTQKNVLKSLPGNLNVTSGERKGRSDAIQICEKTNFSSPPPHTHTLKKLFVSTVTWGSIEKKRAFGMTIINSMKWNEQWEHGVYDLWA